MPAGPTYENSSGEDIFDTDNLLTPSITPALTVNGIIFRDTALKPLGTQLASLAGTLYTDVFSNPYFWMGNEGNGSYQYWNDWGANTSPFNFKVTEENVSAPEPASLTLAGLNALGLLGFAWWRRRKQTA